MRKRILAIVFALMFLNIHQSKAESDSHYQDSELRTYLSQAVSDLETEAKHIKEQYVSVTTRLAKLEYDLPEKYQSLTNLFQLFSHKYHLHIYYITYARFLHPMQFPCNL